MVIGDFKIFTISPQVDMGEVAGQYDAVIVNFYDGSQDNHQLIDEAFRESIGVFRA